MWRRTDDNPSREPDDCFIATGTAALIAGLSAAGASAATGVYGAHKQASAAEDAAKLQTDAAKYGADQQTKASQAAEAFQRQQAENSWQNAERTQQANYGQQKARYGAINQLGSPFGLPAFSMPDYVGGIDPHYDNGASLAPSAGTVSGSQSGGDASKLKALLDGGMDPKQAVAQFNQQYGRTTGNEAVYYDPSKHGGVAAIGLPDAYLAKPGQSWDITNRGGAGTVSGAANASAYGMTAPPMAAPTVNTPLATPYQPGTIAAYGRMR